MLIIAALVLVGLLLGIRITRDEDTLLKILGAIIGVVVGILMGGAIASTVAGYYYPTEEVLDHETRLVSLRSNNQTSGSFFLGSGIIEGREYYYFYETLPSGGFRQSKIPVSDDTIIFEEKRSDGVLRVVRIHPAVPRSSLFAIEGDSQTRWEFHIPEGSIQREFTLR